MALLRKLAWWVQRRRKEDQLLEELQFHLSGRSGGSVSPTVLQKIRPDGPRGANLAM